MKKPIDKFSKQSDSYKKFRPTYPWELFDYIFSFCNSNHTVWDCGTGNGQVAIELSEMFEFVFATDISKNQLQHAVPKGNIIYAVERSESTSFKDNSFDMITVAQALHWFDFKAFNKEVKRVLKPKGLLAVWGYGLLRISPEINALIDHFYTEIVGPYWNKERSHIDNQYQSIPLEVKEFEITKSFEIQVEWDINQLEGYFNSWSSVHNYLEKHHNNNPVSELIANISKIKPQPSFKVSFPIFLRIGKNI